MSLKLFSNYLSNRQQHVCGHNSNSSLVEIKSGVPQGSVFGPILFLLYINDISNALTSPPRLFADDNFLLYSSNNIHQLETLCNQEVSQIKQWMDANKLSINPKKFQACVIKIITNYVLLREI